MKEKKVWSYEELMSLITESIKASEKRFAMWEELEERRRKEREEREEREKEREKEREEREKEREKEREEREKEREKKHEKEREESRERIAKIEKLRAETDEQMKKNDKRLTKKLDRLNEVVNGVSANIGYHAEQYFQEVFSKKRELGGEKYDVIIKNLKAEKRESCEFDIVLVNGASVAIIEAKNRIHPKFIEELATKKVAQFRKFFPVYKDYKLYLGVAGFSFDDSVVEDAKKYGIGIIRQVGDAVEIDDKNLKVY